LLFTQQSSLTYYLFIRTILFIPTVTNAIIKFCFINKIEIRFWDKIYF